MRKFKTGLLLKEHRLFLNIADWKGSKAWYGLQIAWDS
jgi:hypothetical protein